PPPLRPPSFPTRRSSDLFAAAGMGDLLDRLQALENEESIEGAPKDVIGVRPVLMARIQYAAITTEGLLRHAVFKGLREASLSVQDRKSTRLNSSHVKISY